MTTKTYNIKTDGDKKLSTNFTVKEFKSPDSNTVIIDLDNVKQLQKIRSHFKKSVTITSGYRTEAHNKKVGGATKSYHMTGQAADIVVSGVDPLKVYLYADSIGVKGAIYYPNSRFCHIDTRAGKYRAITLDGKTFYAEPTSTLKQGSSGGGVRYLQLLLKYAGYKITCDGKYGPGTKLAVKDFQRKTGLVVDGIAGTKTLKKLNEVQM